MASPSTVITMGFGSFGSVNLLPTLGYGIGVQSLTRDTRTTTAYGSKTVSITAYGTKTATITGRGPT